MGQGTQPVPSLGGVHVSEITAFPAPRFRETWHGEEGAGYSLLEAGTPHCPQIPPANAAFFSITSESVDQSRDLALHFIQIAMDI